MSTSQQTLMPPEIEAHAGVYRSGTRAGHIVVTAVSKPKLTSSAVHQHLRLAVNGELELLEPVSVECDDATCRVDFFSAEISNAGHLPHRLELVWLGDDRCVMCDVPVSELAPSEQVDQPALPRERKPLTLVALVFVVLFALAVYALIVWPI